LHPDPFLHNAWLIVALPFIAGALIILLPFLCRMIPGLPEISRDTRGWKLFSMFLSISAVTIGFIHSIAVFNVLARTGQPYIADATWFQSASFKLTTGLLMDNLTAVMLLVVTTVSLLVQIYTHSYMREDPGYSRFYAYLSLFTGSMLGLVVSTNLFQMYLFWELVGVCSYFLIGFWFYKKSAADACLKAFVVNRIGDFGFLIGILMLLAATWGYWQAHPTHGILTFSDPRSHVEMVEAIRWAFTSSATPLTVPFMTLIACLIFMGPMAKSAQMPLHVWLPDAMEGPTPISALIHAATMVAAGVYMVARGYPIWLNWANPANPVTTGSPSLEFVAWIGTITAIMAATIALTQVDIKRILAWSTVSQLGYMFAGLGVGAYTGGMFHLFTHAFFKAMLFLCSGAVIHALAGEQDVRKMGGLGKDLFWTRWCFLIGCMAIMGVPGFSGFFSKDEIIGAAWASTMPMHELLTIILIFTSGLTAFYMFRCYFLTFSNEYRGEVHPHGETPWRFTTLTAPLVVLAVPSIISGWLGFAPAAWQGQAVHSPFGSFIQWGHGEAVNLMVVAATVAVSVGGWALAAAAYWKRSTDFHTSLAKAMPWAYNFSFNRWYWDTLYLKGAQGFLYLFLGVWTVIDRFIVDKAVDLSARATSGAGGILRYTESGRGQYYALVIFACVAGISIFVYFFVTS
jgi:NAD(P)H-quinone oxidoreductase subunit 5